MFPAGLSPNAPFSPELKCLLPPLWILVLSRFLPSGHPLQARERGRGNTRASSQRGQRAGARWGGRVAADHGGALLPPSLRDHGSEVGLYSEAEEKALETLSRTATRMVPF